MQYAVETLPDYTSLMLQEAALDERISSELKMLAVTLVRDGVKSLLFNLEHCTSCDDSGLGALLIANRLCKNAGGRCVLASVQDSVLQRIHSHQLEAALTIAADRSEAESMLRA